MIDEPGCCCQAIEPADARDPGRLAKVLLEFKGHRHGWFPNPNLVEVVIGSYAVVEADRGEDAGIVKGAKASLPCGNSIQPFKILRAAEEKDIAKIESHRQREHEAAEICRKRISVHHLAMRLVDCEYRLDGLKLTYYFTAEGRVDFRELVRDLAALFRIRIELRQIGARDEFRRTDGYGVCGQRLCCVNFLNGFQPITTGMAKSQHMILNPVKLSGRCGRLKCCLAFENDGYEGSDLHDSLDLPAINEPDEQIDHLSD